MLIFRQKSFQFCTPGLKTQQPVWPQLAYYWFWIGRFHGRFREIGLKFAESAGILLFYGPQIFIVVDCKVYKISNCFLVYVDAADACNMLTFSISENSLVTPMWSIRITQYARDFTNKAPPGCLQYHFGSDTGVVRSFNYNGGAGRHLSNQNQLICIRREATRFRICYSQEGGAVLNDFSVSAGGAPGDATTNVGFLGTVVSSLKRFF